MRIKALYIILVVIAVVISQYASAQYTVEKQVDDYAFRTSIVRTNLLPILWGPIPLTAEYRLVFENKVAAQQAVQVGVSYLGKSIFFSLAEKMDTSGFPEYSVSGVRFQFAYKLYLINRKQKAKIYIAPLISYSLARFRVKIANKNEYEQDTNFNSNLILGFQTPLASSRVDFDLFMGFGYKVNRMALYNLNQQQLPTYEQSGNLTYNGNLKLILGFNIGFVIR